MSLEKTFSFISAGFISSPKFSFPPFQQTNPMPPICFFFNLPLCGLLEFEEIPLDAQIVPPSVEYSDHRNKTDSGPHLNSGSPPSEPSFSHSITKS